MARTQLEQSGAPDTQTPAGLPDDAEGRPRTFIVTSAGVAMLEGQTDETPDDDAGADQPLRH